MKIDLNTLDRSWKIVLKDLLVSDIMENIKCNLANEPKETIYPNDINIFSAFNNTQYNNVKVVIIGQDPYHRKGQAHGLSFSVPYGIKQPPSLKNIFKELYADLGVAIPDSGDLTSWAKQGVLLLNSILTVKVSQPASHSKIGWEEFTDKIIKTISDEKNNVVFVLWGNYAKSKKRLINTQKHYIIMSVHPSPLSAYNGFFGSKPFSKINKYLKSKGIKIIDWSKL